MATSKSRAIQKPPGKGSNPSPSPAPPQNPVRAWAEEVEIPTYRPAPPDKNPMFLEKRVYQGSSGKVYPLPFTDRIAETKTAQRWQAVWLENDYLKVMVLPEIGGRIHVAQDKTNGYDFIYRQTVIKPALVGLAGPWISGGIEFNWPQHHRPATFMPVDYEIEEHGDGSRTVWLSDHDPMARMKGMHGVCLHPGRAYIELKVRAYNRTPFVQTFLWWANVAARVHESYQSFFPPDVYYVADHAKRATSKFPLCEGHYYGVDYRERARNGVPEAECPGQFIPRHSGGSAPEKYAPNDLAWYANIPVPTSYMAMGSQEDFFGGYDHARQAGLVHVANHHIAPGKKQWTWGNHEFGYAWDRNLTDTDGPYIELMAGVYTDNQPDFSFLQPGETKAWSQYWYPIQRIGPARHANLDAAVNLEVDARCIRVGVSVTSAFPRATVCLENNRGVNIQWQADLQPGQPFQGEHKQTAKKWALKEVTLRVLAEDGREIISCRPKPPLRSEPPPPATVPLPPSGIASADELFITGLHLEQYRHATRCPTDYWREALRRDPADARCNNALGLWHLRRGEFARAETHFRTAVERLTLRNPNPGDGEAHYNLGQCLRFRLDALPGTLVAGTASPLFEEAYAAFYKAAWSRAWAAPACHALAELDCRRNHWRPALEHLDQSLRHDSDNLRARDLKVMVLRQLKQSDAADELLRANLALDPLDAWARWLAGRPLLRDAQMCLDLAHDLARAGRTRDAIGLLRQVKPAAAALADQNLGVKPLLEYTLGWLAGQVGDKNGALGHYARACKLPPDYCFPARLEEIAILQAAIDANPLDPMAPYYLGNLLYDRRRHQEAIRFWEHSAKRAPRFATAWRNLGIGYYNILQQPQKARAAYQRACRANPDDARLFFERDQLWKRLGEAPEIRLRELEKHPGLVRLRDDLAVELCALYNQTGSPQKALDLLTQRHFQPWEGGEGQALGQYARSCAALGKRALAAGDATGARRHFAAAMNPPPNLGEAKHLLANQGDIHYWLGRALAGLGDPEAARGHWQAAANFTGDFQEMRVRAFSELTYYSARSLECLGDKTKARQLFEDLLAHARQLAGSTATIEYFATSLPTMLLFEDDLQQRQAITAKFLEAQALAGLSLPQESQQLLSEILRADPSHSLAADFMAG